MTELHDRQCVPCRVGAPPPSSDDVERWLASLDAGWRVVDAHHLEKDYRFRTYRDALNFTIHVGELAEAQGHHPEIHLAWRRVRLLVWTHKIDGLSESDFVLAAKADRLFTPAENI